MARILIFILLVLASCKGDDYLRGSVIRSEDGKTYLSIVDDNGGHCDIYVDDKLWSYTIDEAGIILPGTHKISCGVDIWFEIPEGKIFQFDYWGP